MMTPTDEDLRRIARAAETLGETLEQFASLAGAGAAPRGSIELCDGMLTIVVPSHQIQAVLPDCRVTAEIVEGEIVLAVTQGGKVIVQMRRPLAS